MSVAAAAPAEPAKPPKEKKKKKKEAGFCLGFEGGGILSGFRLHVYFNLCSLVMHTHVPSVCMYIHTYIYIYIHIT